MWIKCIGKHEIKPDITQHGVKKKEAKDLGQNVAVGGRKPEKEIQAPGKSSGRNEEKSKDSECPGLKTGNSFAKKGETEKRDTSARSFMW